MRRRYRWPLWTLAAVALLLVLAGAAVHVMMLQIPERRTEIQHWINGATGLDLRLGKLTTRWRLTGPELYAANVEVFTPRGEIRLARAREVSVRVDFWRMLSRFELLAGRVRLVGPEVRLVRTPDGKIGLEGRPLENKQKTPDSDRLPNGWLEIVDGRVILSDVGGQEELSTFSGPSLINLAPLKIVDNSSGPHDVSAQRSTELLRLEGLHLKLERHRDTLKFSGNLNLLRTLGDALNFSGAAQGRLDDPSHLSWTLKADGRELHLGAWRSFIGERWRTLDPRGEIHSLSFALSKAAAQQPRFTVAARFAGLGFEPVGKLPGVRGLDGEIDASEHSGKARLASRSLVFLMPRRFREPLLADTVNGEVSWKREAAGWQIASRQFLARNPHANVRADIDLTLPVDGSSPILKLRGRFQEADIKEGWRYLPIDRLGKKTLAWLDAAFLGGRAPAGELVFDGPTRKFPFRNGEGEFRVRFPVEGLTLHYGNGWPDLDTLAADVEFHNAGLTGTVRGGQLNGLEIAPGATAQFADFKTGELKIRGRADGDLGAALGFLQKSPLGPKFGKTFMDLRGQGPVGAEIDLLLPVKHLADRKVNLLATFNRGRLRLEGTGHAVQELRGSLRVNDKQIAGSGLTATYLGGPIAIDLAPEKSTRRAMLDTVVRVRAQTPANALADAIHLPDSVDLGGTLDWRATLRMPIRSAPAGPARISLRIDSSLRGTQVGLPAPLNKTPAETRPLRIDVQWPDPRTALVRVAYAGAGRAQLGLKADETGWSLARGAVKLGPNEGEVPLPGSDGLFVDGALDSFDLSAWLAVRSDKPGKRPLSSYLRSVDVTVRDFGLYGFHFSAVKGRLVPGERAWVVNVEAPRASGSVRVPYDLQGPEPLILDMARLTLQQPAASPEDKGRRGDVDPTKWPAVKASVADFEAWNKHFGSLHAELVRVPAGLELKSLDARTPSFSLTGSGSWTVAPAGQRSLLKLKLDSTDVLQTLQDLGYGASLTGKRGLATLDLNWPGAPDARLMARLSGTMSVEVENGQLVGVQPGAGRVFGLMSVAMLRRRLALDFSDLTDKGLAFDSILGDFTLESGNAYTSNLLLKGPAAEIGIVGRTGLEARDYDQTAVVTGNIGQSLPMAGALAGGPAVGAALLVFSQIFKQPLRGIARGYYRITGSWDEPNVQRVEASEVKKAD